MHYVNALTTSVREAISRTALEDRFSEQGRSRPVAKEHGNRTFVRTLSIGSICFTLMSPRFTSGACTWDWRRIDEDLLPYCFNQWWSVQVGVFWYGHWYGRGERQTCYLFKTSQLLWVWYNDILKIVPSILPTNQTEIWYLYSSGGGCDMPHLSCSSSVGFNKYFSS